MIQTWNRWHRRFVGLLWDLDGWVTRLWYRRRIRVEGRCEPCGECCRRVVLWDRGQPLRDAEGFARLVRSDAFTYQRFEPYGRNAAGDLLFRCSKLGADNLCTVHAERPVLCRRYPEPRMFLHGGSLPQGCTYTVTVQIT
jgi:Fe-S-cluster containining protein